MKFVKHYAAPLLALAAALMLAACASSVKAPVADTPEAAGTNPQVLLLGEVVDNSQGHRMLFEELRRRVEAGWRPAIAMEQFDRESQPLLDDAQKGCIDAACLIQVVGGPLWDWQQYYNVIDMALTYHLPIIAVNLSRSDASRVVRDGLTSAFDARAVADFHLDQPLPAEIRAAQQEQIAAAHCNMLPDMMVGGLIDAQVARDVWMAKLIRAQRPRDVVLIAANAHVRKDVGVARWLQIADPSLSVRSIGFVESAAPAGRYDAVRQLAPLTRPGPCAGLTPKS